MKRALGLIILTAAFIVGFLSIRGAMSFIPIVGSSMEPTLHSGSLLMIKPIDPAKVKVGDIIVYNVPALIREHYSYPPVISHRVIEINTQPTLSFRAKGDNTGEDPFSIMPGDIRGTVGDQIPYLGLPLLFLQSQQGMIFVIVALCLLAFFLYGGEISRGGNILHRGIFAPVINEEKRANRVLARKIDATERKVNSTEQALEKFTAAISEYAQHLASHTSAIQGLAEASHELKRSAAEQNKVITYLINSLEQPGLNINELALRAKQAAQETEKPPRAEQAMPEAIKPPVEAVRPAAEAANKQFPPGCARRRQPLTTWQIPNKPGKPLA